MEFKPIIVIQSEKNVSLKRAKKAITKFVAENVTKNGQSSSLTNPSGINEDIIEKLAVIQDSLLYWKKPKSKPLDSNNPLTNKKAPRNSDSDVDNSGLLQDKKKQRRDHEL